MQCSKNNSLLPNFKEFIMATKTFSPVLPHSLPSSESLGNVFAKIGAFFATLFEVFHEAQVEARKAHAKYPFAE